MTPRRVGQWINNLVCQCCHFVFCYIFSFVTYTSNFFPKTPSICALRSTCREIKARLMIPMLCISSWTLKREHVISFLHFFFLPHETKMHPHVSVTGNNHAHTHTYEQLNPTCMFLEGRRKSEYSKKTYAGTGRTQKACSERVQPGIEPETSSLL